MIIFTFFLRFCGVSDILMVFDINLYVPDLQQGIAAISSISIQFLKPPSVEVSVICHKWTMHNSEPYCSYWTRKLENFNTDPHVIRVRVQTNARIYSGTLSLFLFAMLTFTHASKELLRVPPEQDSLRGVVMALCFGGISLC